jgi:hypothetical protein
LSNAERTATGRRKFGLRFLAKEIKDGHLRAAKIGGRGQVLVHIDWLQQYVVDQAKPIEVVRRRA